MRKSAISGQLLETQDSVSDAVQRSAPDTPAKNLFECVLLQKSQSCPRAPATREQRHGTHKYRCVSRRTALRIRVREQSLRKRRPWLWLPGSARNLHPGVRSVVLGPAVPSSPLSASSATPNPSVKLSANGRPPGPSHRYGVHFLWLGPGVLPSSPAYLQR